MFVIECRKTKGGKVSNWFPIFHCEDGAETARYLTILVLAENCLEGFRSSVKQEYHIVYEPETVQPPPVPDEPTIDFDAVERGDGDEE